MGLVGTKPQLGRTQGTWTGRAGGALPVGESAKAFQGSGWALPGLELDLGQVT